MLYAHYIRTWPSPRGCSARRVARADVPRSRSDKPPVPAPNCSCLLTLGSTVPGDARFGSRCRVRDGWLGDHRGSARRRGATTVSICKFHLCACFSLFTNHSSVVGVSKTRLASVWPMDKLTHRMAETTCFCMAKLVGGHRVNGDDREAFFLLPQPSRLAAPPNALDGRAHRLIRGAKIMVMI